MTAEADKYRITICSLREWDACKDGCDWFRAKFPNGATYSETINALMVEARLSDAEWLNDKAFTAWETDGEFIAQYVADQIRIATQAADEQKEGNHIHLAASGYAGRLTASGYASHLAASGAGSRLAALGDDSSLAASGDHSHLAASGYAGRLAASGYASHLAASGAGSRLAASGDDSSLAASGDHSRLAASGDDSRLAASGAGSRICLGLDSCGAAVWYDGGRYRFATCTTADGELSPGEQRIKPGVWYRVNDKGQFVECEA